MATLGGEALLCWIAPTPGRAPPDLAQLSAAEWDDLFSQACRHGVAAQLLRGLLASAAPGTVPRAALQALGLAVAQQRATAARLQRELAAVLRCLAEADVTPVLLKGAHLALAVYPEPGLRPMQDVDLLLRTVDLARAEQALQAVGYVSERTEAMVDYPADPYYNRLPLLRRGAWSVEMHWALAPPADGLPIDLDALWRRVEPITVGGAPALVLAPEDALLHVCLHGVLQHLFEFGLRPVLDVAAIVERHGPTFDWPAVEARARAWGVERAVYLVLALAQRDLHAAIPPEVLTGLIPEGLAPSVLHAARAMMLEPPGRLPLQGSTRSVAAAYVRPRFLFDYVFCSRDALEREYGPASTRAHRAVHYARRATGLLGRYGGVAWQMLRGDRALLTTARARVRSEIVLQQWLERVPSLPQALAGERGDARGQDRGS